MMIILKNLWHRRAKNGWLFTELVIVTALLYFMIDLPLVGYYESSLPIGYDSERLAILSFENYREGMSQWTAEGDSAEVNEAALWSIYNNLLSHPMVETATISSDGTIPATGSHNSNTYYSGNQSIDTVTGGFLTAYYVPGTHYFETMGITTRPGYPSPEALSEMNDGGLIITSTFGEHFWPGEEALGKRMRGYVWEGRDTTWMQVSGVVEPFRYDDYQASSSTVFRNTTMYFPLLYGFTIAARMRDGIQPQEFEDELREWGAKNLTQGNFYLNKVSLHSKMRADEHQVNLGSKLALMELLAAFFLISVILGTIGNMWLQTYKREREIGVLRSFGATRGDILRMLLGESFILALVAFVIGAVIFSQWALKFGLSTGADFFTTIQKDPVWTQSFGLHFLVLSIAVFVILELSVLIGTWFPAYKLSRINPVDALRDE